MTTGSNSVPPGPDQCPRWDLNLRPAVEEPDGCSRTTSVDGACATHWASRTVTWASARRLDSFVRRSRQRTVESTSRNPICLAHPSDLVERHSSSGYVPSGVEDPELSVDTNPAVFSVTALAVGVCECFGHRWRRWHRCDLLARSARRMAKRGIIE